MKRITKGLIYFWITLTFLGCASGNRKETAALRSFIKARDFQKAQDLVTGDKFINDENSLLLKYLEQGTVFNLNGNLYQSLKAFEKAKELSDKLFTVSLSKKVTSAITNDNYDNYYGEKYERSMIRFYLSLNHLLLYIKGEYEAYKIKETIDKKVVEKEVAAKILDDKEKRFHLMAARSILIEWNSLLDNYKSTTGGVVTYKDDLLAKVFGAFVHEQFFSRDDNRVALDLYKEAKNVLLKNFNILKTYNLKASKFKKDYANLYKLPLEKVEKDYVERTEYSKTLLSYLDDKIKQLSKSQNDNVFVLLEDNLITPKSVSKIDVPLPMGTVSVVTGGKLSFAAFVAHMLSIPSGKPLKFYFEVPSIPFRSINDQYDLVVKTKDGKVVESVKTAIVNPLGDLAYLTLDEKKTSLYAKAGARVATKHVTALIAAYAIYKTQAKNSEFFALAAASLSYAAANKGIEASERADIRYWSSLPMDYQVASFRLPKGEYSVFVKDISGNEKEVSSISVESFKKPIVVKERLVIPSKVKVAKKTKVAKK